MTKLDLDTLCARARQRFTDGDYDGAQTFVRAAQTAAGDDPPPELLRLLGLLTAEFGDIAGGAALLDQALDGFRIADDTAGEVICAGNLAALLQRTGPLVRARTLVTQALARVDPNDTDQRSRLLNVAANVAVLQGYAAEALEHAQQACEHAEGRVACWAELTTATALEHGGCYADAGAALDRAAKWIESNDLVNRALLHAARARLHMLENDAAAAQQACARVLAYVDSDQHQWIYYPTLALCAVLLRENGRCAEAEPLLRVAMQWAQRSGDQSAIIGIEWHRAALYHAVGDESCTAEHLATALGAMRANGFVTAALWQPDRVAELCVWASERNVEAAYAALVLHCLPNVPARAHANVTPSHTSTLAHLTRREREVLELTARGFSNGEIAQSLHLSIRTVRNHLQRCYDKLGVRGRAEAMQKVGN